MLSKPANKASSLYGNRVVSPLRAGSAGRWLKDGSRMRGLQIVNTAAQFAGDVSPFKR